MASFVQLKQEFHISRQTMPKAAKAKWLAALRSGDYQQTFGTMCECIGAEDEGEEPVMGFCCLGVLEHCLTGGVEFDTIDFNRVPTYTFAKQFNLKFANEGDAGNPTLIYKGEPQSASDLNDSGRMSFKQIANLIDKQIEGV